MTVDPPAADFRSEESCGCRDGPGALHISDSWDGPLGELNRHQYRTLGAPALSAVVLKADTREPGGRFWDCVPNVPPRPTTDIDRLSEWSRILNEVHAYKWPAALP